MIVPGAGFSVEGEDVKACRRNVGSGALGEGARDARAAALIFAMRNGLGLNSTLSCLEDKSSSFNCWSLVGPCPSSESSSES